MAAGMQARDLGRLGQSLQGRLQVGKCLGCGWQFYGSCVGLSAREQALGRVFSPASLHGRLERLTIAITERPGFQSG
jgi:hypothetical protein